MSEPLSPDMILQTALEFRDEQERSTYLDETCGTDQSLRDEIESLITAYFADETFLSHMAAPLWQEPPCEREGDQIGSYKLLRKIGEGGFGTVFLAEQTHPVKRRVALKVIKPGMDSQEIITRFQAERQALALMDHPHIARIHDAGTSKAGRPYFVMELAEGPPITQYCAEAGLEIRERLRLFLDVCAAVQHAHQKGIIHRDLKPTNILVSLPDGRPCVKVIDFGIAKAIGMELTENTRFTQLGRIMGTPQYMSPEQAQQNALMVDTRSDIYSLGAVLYELLTGTTPLEDHLLRGADHSEIQRLIREKLPSRPSEKLSNSLAPSSIQPRALRGDLDWIVLKALEKEPSRRYESAAALADDLVRYLEHKPIEARPPGLTYVMMRFTRRNQGPVFAAAALLLALILGAAGTTIGMKRALEARDALASKNVELDRQKLELIDSQERLAGLLDANQKMLDEISRLSTGQASLPAEFDKLRAENQSLLDKVSNEVANQQRYEEEIKKLQNAKEQMEERLGQQDGEIAALKKEKQQIISQLSGERQGTATTASGSDPSDAPLDPATGAILAPHTLVSLTTEQIEETQTLGTLTLTPEQWQEARAKSPQCPKRFESIVSAYSPDIPPGTDDAHVILLARDRVALLHGVGSAQTVEAVRGELFREALIPLRMNERGQVYLRARMISYPILLKALASPPDDAARDSEGKLVAGITSGGDAGGAPRWLSMQLPTGAQRTGAVYHTRLREIAAAADQMGLRHDLFGRAMQKP